MKKLLKLLKDEGGAISIEHGLVAALIAVVILVAMTTIGLRLFTAIYSTDTSSP